jgi:hypothetical protein
MMTTPLLVGSLVVLAVGGASVGTAAAGPASSTTVGRCHISQLSVHHGASDGAAGTIGVPIVFRNTSSRTCELTGYPGALRLDKHHNSMRTTVVRGGSTIYPDPGPTRVVLAPGHRASVGLAWSDVTSTEGGCHTSTYLEVTPPNDFDHKTIKLATDACDHGTLDVTAVQTGKTPAQ